MGSGDSAIQVRIDSVAAAITFVDPTDLQALAELHSGFEEIARLADGSQPSVVVDAALAAAVVIERIIMNETPDGGAALRVVAQTIGALQEIIRDGRPVEQVRFPAELPLAVEEVYEEESAETYHASALPPDADAKLFHAFLARQDAAIGEMETMILALAKTADEDSLTALKRLIRMLKGEASGAGPQEVDRLCRVTQAGPGGRAAGEMIDGLLQVKEWFAQAFQACAGTTPLPATLDEALARMAATQALPEAAGKAPESAVGDRDEQTDRALLAEFICEAAEHLEAVDVHLLALETDPHDKEAIDAAFRAFHTVKGVASCLGIDNIREVAHEAESLLARARQGELVLRGEPIDVSFEAVDVIRRMVEALRDSLATGKAISADPAPQGLKARIAAAIASADSRHEDGLSQPGGDADISPASGEAPRKLGEILVEQGSAAPETIQQALDRQSRHEKRPPLGTLLVQQGKVPARAVARALRVQTTEAMQIRETVRIDAKKLDRLLEAIGHLGAVESAIKQSSELRQAASPAVLDQLDLLGRITRELQSMGLSLRMVPIRGTFKKMARLARDLARKVDKPVEFVTSGEDTELDRRTVDRVAESLVHMVRNALDHGIEASPQQRCQAGKPRVGRIELRAFYEHDSICIEVADDGRGLDREAILGKAVERGLVTPGAELTDQEVYSLVFVAGLSTAQVVTDVSGRGVGMDVVRRNVEQLCGQVEIHSVAGAGTTFRIRLPRLHKG